MKVTIIGASYVELVAGCCFSEIGASVAGLDFDESRFVEWYRAYYE